MNAVLQVRIANWYSKLCWLCEQDMPQGADVVRVGEHWCHATCAEDAGYEVKL
jgi:hypothetical protein